MTTVLRFSLTLFLIISSSLSQARQIADYNFAEQLSPQPEQPALLLNGASVRSYYYLIDTYVGLLYMENPASNAQQLIDDPGYKRIVYHILVDRVSGRRIAKAMYEALQLNVSREQALQLEDRLNKLVKMFDSKMERGDQGYVDYVPGVGSRVVIKGETKGILPGKDLYDALLKIWIGEYPVSRRFKQDILNYQPDAVAGS
ncbi:chalcone isomerase family protein [Bacterioplanoides pacificum]|uniref:Chalcone isomerase family protein n=1 Tax=Bacterioplanoides pacificum TaxID=1171596 RepID=A0ABV7VSS2_9GAMM